MASRYKQVYKKRSRLILLLFFMAYGCAGINTSIIFYSGNINGNYESCNCPKLPDGSILNHITFKKDSIGNSDSAINISTGNIFTQGNDEKDDRIILALFDSLGYDVYVPGENDLEMLDNIKLKECVTAWNIEGCSPFKEFKKRNVTICITGMIDPQSMTRNDKVTIFNRSIREIIEYTDSLKNFCDLVVFVSNLNSDFEKKVFNEVESIDIMISGINRKNESIKFGNRFYVSPGKGPEFTGKFVISRNSSGYKFDNKFIEMDYENIREDEVCADLIDSLKIESGMKIRIKSIDSDL